MTDWPHAPPHRTLAVGTYMVTAPTYQKLPHFNTTERLDLLHARLLRLARTYGWQMQAWAVFASHYHFIAQSPDTPENLSVFISQLHVETARQVNAEDHQLNRKVWWQYWDTRITYPYSYLARLNYVNQNPVKHGLVPVANDYPWCSASWFEETTPKSFSNTVAGFKTDTLKVIDDF